MNEHITERAAKNQVTALALSNSAHARHCELAQRTRASIMRLRGPTFLPSTADRMRRSAHPCTLHHRKSAHEAAKASETFSDHVRTRPEAPRAKNLRCSSGRCWRRRCGRGGATSRCWLVQLGELGAWAAVSGAAEQCWAGGPALARRFAEKTNVSSQRGAARGTSAREPRRQEGAFLGQA